MRRTVSPARHTSEQALSIASFLEAASREKSTMISPFWIETSASLHPAS